MVKLSILGIVMVEAEWLVSLTSDNSIKDWNPGYQLYIGAEFCIYLV